MGSFPKLPSAAGTFFSLTEFHVEEVYLSVKEPASGVEQVIRPGFLLFDPGVNGGPNFMSESGGLGRLIKNQDPRLYLVKVNNPAGNLSPEDVTVKFVSAVEALGATLSLSADGTGGKAADQAKLCLVSGKPKRSNVRDLNFRPGDLSAPMTDLVEEIKEQNITGFADSVFSYLGKYVSPEKQAEYGNMINAKTDEEVEDLDSIRIWNMLTLPEKVQRELLEKGLIEAPMSFEDLPLPEEVFPTPPPGWMAGNNAYKTGPLCASSIDFNLLNFQSEQSSVAKRKEVEGMDDPCLQQKKPRHTGVVGIDESEDIEQLAGKKVPMEAVEASSDSA